MKLSVNSTTLHCERRIVEFLVKFSNNNEWDVKAT